MTISELKNGEARQYAKEMRNREISYLSNQKNIIVDELTAKPKMLFHLDISTDKNYWSNMNVTRYFRKESVILKEK